MLFRSDRDRGRVGAPGGVRAGAPSRAGPFVNILACVKRVPATGGRVTLTDDGRAIDARFLSFTISPHEECAVEAAVQLAEASGGGTTTVLTLGPEAAADQLRDSLAVGMTRAVHLVTEGEDWDPIATAAAIVDAIHADAADGIAYDLLLFGNEAAEDRKSTRLNSSH